MKSVAIPISVWRTTQKKKSGDSPMALEELAFSTNSVQIIQFPLQTSSKDYLILEDERHQESAKLLAEDFKLYLKLLQLASSPIPQENLSLSLREVSCDIINRLDRSQGAAPLQYASMNGNLPLVTFLLENGAEVDIWDDNKKVTPLACAAAHGQLEIVKILLEHNTDINAGLNSAGSGQTSALVWAVRWGHAEIVRYLLEHNACQNSSVPFSETPIHTAVLSGYPEILEMLIQAQSSKVKADLQMGTEKNTPLHLAASGQHENSLELCKILVEQAGVQINPSNSNEITPLHAAAAGHNVEIAKLLISHWAATNAVDKEGKTPIFYSIGDSDKALECLETLIKRGKCDVNHQDKQGNTALHLAAIAGAAGAAEVLLMNGADFSIKSDGGTSALSILRRKIPDTQELLHKVFDQAVTVTNFHNSSSETRQDYKVKVNFRYVLPAMPTQTSSSPSQEEQIKRLRTGGPRMALEFKNTQDGNRRPLPLRKETAKIKCLIDEEHSCLLLHPVVHSFLELKWCKTRPIFLPTLIFKAILVILFSTYVQLPYVLNGMFGMPMPPAAPVNGTRSAMPSRYDVFSLNGPVVPTWYKGMYVAIVTMAVLRGIMELMQIARAPKSQLRTLHPWIYLAVLLIMIFYMKPRTWKRTNDPFRRSMTSLGILLAWVDIWIEMGRFPKIGLSIRVFHRVLKNFSLFILPHFCLLAGFIFAFTLLFHENGEFSSIAMTITKIIRIMAGDITIVSQGMKTLTPNNSTEEIFTHILLVYIYTAYVLIVAIVLMNLLIGLAVNDIQGIYAEASIDKLEKQTILINTLESNFSGKYVKAWLGEFFSKFTNLFHPSSQNKILTFKPYDSRDSKMSKEQKIALLNIGNTTKETETIKKHSVMAPSSPNAMNLWKATLKSAKQTTGEEEQRELMEKINELVATFLADKKQ